MSNPRYSIIIPVFNRPDEVNELLASLTAQSFRNFEVLVVEDGSAIRCDQIVDQYRDKLNIQYFFKPNSGPGPSRNFGFSHAHGDYFVVFDSDCIIPPAYLTIVEQSITVNAWDAWGGPDRAHANFSPLQQAMGYTMSSVLTTGGIRGAKKHIGKFQPRSFNMGISRKVFEKLGGFNFTHSAEDIEFSIRMENAGLRVGLIAEAFVFHKRRTDLKQFYKQVSNFGRGRVQVGRVHPSEVKLAHWFPTFFFLGEVGLLIAPLISISLFLLGCILFASYLSAIFIDAFQKTASAKVAYLSVPSALTQLNGYGIGFLSEKLRTLKESLVFSL